MLFEKYKDTLIRLALVAAMSFVMALMLFLPVSAAEYDCGAYGAGSFGEGQVCGSTSNPVDPPAEDDLTNTGQRALTIIIPALMILVGTVMLYRLNRKRGVSSSD